MKKTEVITSLDEAKIIGYFETVKSNFYLQTMFEALAFNEKGQFIIKCPEDIYKIMKINFSEFERFVKYLYHGNGAIRDNFHDLILTDLIINSWIIFEMIIKDLANKDYSLINSDQSVNYNSNSLGFSDNEKKDIDLFYYIRNAFSHYNGAYYAYKNIDHVYNGVHFISKGNEGKKIHIPDLKFAYKIHIDIEKLIIKGWGNYLKLGKR